MPCTGSTALSGVRHETGVVLQRVRIKEDPSLYGDCTGIA